MTISDLRYAIETAKDRMNGYAKDAKKCEQIRDKIPEIISDLIQQKKEAEDYIQSDSTKKPVLYHYREPDNVKIADFNYIREEYEFLSNKQEHYKYETKTFIKIVDSYTNYLEKQKIRWNDMVRMFKEEADFYSIKNLELSLELDELLFGESIKNLEAHSIQKGYLEFDKRIFNKYSFRLNEEIDKEEIRKIKKFLTQKVVKLSPSEIENFLDTVALFLNYIEIVTKTGIYKEGQKISEKKFHKDLYLYINSVNNAEEYYSEVHKGGGIIDFLYKNIPIELKVCSIKSKAKMVDNYIGQIGAYLVNISSRLGILCILDTSIKKNWDYALEQKTELIFYPNKELNKNTIFICVVVVPGNMKNPSSYSR